MTLTVAQALASQRPRLGIFFRLHIDPVVRLWLGVGHAVAGIDADDGAGATYKGLGTMLNLPALNQLVNGAADRVEFTLAGVSSEIMAMASTEADEVKGAALLIGVGVFDANWQLIAQPTWLRRFIADFVKVEMDSGEDGITRAVVISARTFLTGRRRPGLSYWTDADQQALHPGDKFCERTVLYSQETMKPWPRFS